MFLEDKDLVDPTPQFANFSLSEPKNTCPCDNLPQPSLSFVLSSSLQYLPSFAVKSLVTPSRTLLPSSATPHLVPFVLYNNRGKDRVLSFILPFSAIDNRDAITRSFQNAHCRQVNDVLAFHTTEVQFFPNLAYVL